MLSPWNPLCCCCAQVRDPSARVEHEASTSKIGEDQLFYFQQVRRSCARCVLSSASCPYPSCVALSVADMPLLLDPQHIHVPSHVGFEQGEGWELLIRQGGGSAAPAA